MFFTIYNMYDLGVIIWFTYHFAIFASSNPNPNFLGILKHLLILRSFPLSPLWGPRLQLLEDGLLGPQEFSPNRWRFPKMPGFPLKPMTDPMGTMPGIFKYLLIYHKNQLPSLKLTANAPENRPKPKRKGSSSNYHFSGENSLLEGKLVGKYTGHRPMDPSWERMYSNPRINPQDSGWVLKPHLVATLCSSKKTGKCSSVVNNCSWISTA